MSHSSSSCFMEMRRISIPTEKHTKCISHFRLTFYIYICFAELFNLSIHSFIYPLFYKVLSHNLCTVLCIPHDPVALEEHFRDDDDGPVSSQGYMPYLNKYILDKVTKAQRCRYMYLLNTSVSPLFHETCTRFCRR